MQLLAAVVIAHAARTWSRTPALRNIALTQPYSTTAAARRWSSPTTAAATGAAWTADTSGFSGAGATKVHPAMRPLGLSQAERDDLVGFMRHAPADRRVACERAPFDHPSPRLVEAAAGRIARGGPRTAGARG